MILPEHFISIDWGTTNFRLRLVVTETLTVLETVQTNVGIKTLNDLFLKQSEKNRQDTFGDYLVSQIQKLETEHQKNLVVISGMASSNIGLEEMTYAEVPFDGSGSNLNWKVISLTNDLETILISGVKTDSSVMRGEEIQAIGLEELLQPYQEGVLLLPGTHSKHLNYKNGQFTTMKTFMTGELFQLLSQKSILSDSVQAGHLTEIHKKAFVSGVKKGSSESLSSILFSVRTNTLLHDISKEDNYFLLSGMLIGSELAYLKDHKSKLFLCAAEPVFTLYQMALATLHHSKNIIVFDASYILQALLKGQRKIINQYVS